jgi:hypothetical protein
MKKIRLISAFLVSALLLTSCNGIKAYLGIAQDHEEVSSSDETSESVAASTPVTDTPEESQDATGESVPETVPTEAAPSVPDYVRTAAYASYLALLEEQKEDIVLYTWMSSESDVTSDDAFWIEAVQDIPCALADLTGDGLDELIVFKVQRDEESNNIVAATCNIYTYNAEEDIPVSILELTDLDVRGSRTGNVCYLFSKLNDGSLMMYESSNYDQTWEDSLVVYSFDGEALTRNLCLTVKEITNIDYTELILKYYIDGVEVTEDDFNARREELIGSVRTLLQYNYVFYDPICEAFRGVNSNAMTYDAAYEVLSAASASHFEPLPEDQAAGFFALIQDDYLMPGGTDGRGAILTVNPDGTINYNYHDSDYSTYSICHASGRIGNVRLIRENVYAVDVTELTLEYAEGTQWVETDEFGDETNYYATDSFGIHQGDVLMFYQAGVSTSSLPTAYLESYITPRGMTSTSQVPDPMPLDGFFNVSDECAFIEEEYD